jgi:hypothetical protein
VLELRERIRRSQLVQVVDDQHDGLGLFDEVREDPVGQLIVVETSARRRVRAWIDRARRTADRVEDRTPEPLCILLVAVDRHERHAARARRAVGPATQQRGLSTSGWR